MTQLANKVAWITGAGSGIGEAAALVLAEAGAAVVLTGRRPELLEALAVHIRSNGGEVLVAPAMSPNPRPQMQSSNALPLGRANSTSS